MVRFGLMSLLMIQRHICLYTSNPDFIAGGLVHLVQEVLADLISVMMWPTLYSINHSHLPHHHQYHHQCYDYHQHYQRSTNATPHSLIIHNRLQLTASLATSSSPSLSVNDPCLSTTLLMSPSSSSVTFVRSSLHCKGWWLWSFDATKVMLF